MIVDRVDTRPERSGNLLVAQTERFEFVTCVSWMKKTEIPSTGGLLK